MAGAPRPGDPGAPPGRGDRRRRRHRASDHAHRGRRRHRALPRRCRSMIEDRWLLVIDTATSRVVVAAGRPDGSLIDEAAFPAEHRHGERLLATLDELAKRDRLVLERISGIIVGTGPGAFTGLRVGLATAKTLAHELRVPIAGISTAEALLSASGAERVWLPAGPNDRVVVDAGAAPRLVTGLSAAGDASAEADVGPAT